MIRIEFTVEGVFYIPENTSREDWYRYPFEYGDSSGLVAFLSQLEEEGYAEARKNVGLILPWRAYYDLIESAAHKASLPLLQLPDVTEWIPELSSKGGLSDPDFSITISGWKDTYANPVKGNVDVIGGVLKTSSRESILPRPVWETVTAIADFHARPKDLITPDDNRRAWSRIRRGALNAKADLSDFLRKTIVLTPERLKLGMRKGRSVGESKTVEVIPSFEDAPSQWLELFDKFPVVNDRYDIPDGAGLVQVLISPEIKTVLKEIKQMPGRRVSGERAEAFIRNPFGLLGPETEKVVDPQQFERAREEAGLSFARFTARVLRDKKGGIRDVSLVIDDVLEGIEKRDEYRFENPDDLERFTIKLRERIKRQAQCCIWEGYELEILGDTPDQLEQIENALAEWRRSERITSKDIFDLSHYYGRIEAIGTEKTYYSPFITLKKDGGEWIPENIDDIGIFYTSAGAHQPIGMTLDQSGVNELKIMIEEAKRDGSETINFAGFPTPISVTDAENIVKIYVDILKRSKSPRDLPKPTKLALIIKPNINTSDYIENLGPLNPPENSPDLPKNLKDKSVLKDHQLRGIAWLQSRWEQSPSKCRGGILADDMGLGKTLQLLAFISRSIENDLKTDPVLIVAPVSLLENWRTEYEKFFLKDSLKILMLYGEELKKSMAPRNTIDTELQDKGVTRLLKNKWLGHAKIVLTTYETMRDLEFSLARQKWSIMICDEAQKIKNPNALVTRAAKKQNARFKIACTGTPVENSLTDLWCLFDFIQPGLLGALNNFGRIYKRPIEAKTDEEKKRVEELRAMIDPQLIRRMKSDVAKDLPHKEEKRREMPMSNYQRKLYGETAASFRVTPTKGLIGMLQQLRKICSHPTPAGQLASINESLSDIEQRSPKIGWLMSEIERIKAKNEKVIIFCDLRDIQRVIQHCVREKFGLTPDIINGDSTTSVTSARSRQKRIDAFQVPLGFGVIVLSQLAVGFGVNIQAANHVIHFMRSWNPAKEDQATDRAYRIGQNNAVFVYYPLVTSNFDTFDIVLDGLLNRKRELSRDILNGSGAITPKEFVGIQGPDGEVIPPGYVTDDDLKQMDPVTFENFCALLWAKQGYNPVIRTPQSGDGGVDVVAIRENEGILIQCKTSADQDKRLGWEAIKDVVGGIAAYERKFQGVTFDKVAVTNQRFNDNARQQAELNDVKLTEREDLLNMLANTPISIWDI